MTLDRTTGDVWGLVVAVFLASPGLAIVAPLVGAIRADLGVSNFEAGLVVAIFGLARLAADLPAGLLADRVARRTLTVAGFGLLVAGSLVSALAPSLLPMLAGRVLTGLGSALVMTGAITWAGAIAPPGGQARVISRIEAAWMTSATVSPVIGGAIAAIWDWRATFVYCAIAALSSALLLAALGRRARAEAGASPAPAQARGRKGHGHGVRLVASRPVLAAYLAGFLMFFNRNGVRNTLLPLFAASVVGLDPAGIGLAVDRTTTLMLAAVLIGLGGLNSSVPAALISANVPGSRLGGAIGGYRFTQDGGFVAGPLAIGLVLDRLGYHAGLLFAAAVMLVGLAAVGALLRPARGPLAAA